jgi:hypothetical protein
MNLLATIAAWFASTNIVDLIARFIHSYRSTGRPTKSIGLTILVAMASTLRLSLRTRVSAASAEWRYAGVESDGTSSPRPRE